MIEKNKLNISTQELVHSLFQLGYKKKAKEIEKNYFNKGKIAPEIKNLATDTENRNEVLQYFVKSRNSIIFENETRKLAIHSIEQDKILTELIENGRHIFSLLNLEEGLYRSIIQFYNLQATQKDDLYREAIAMDVSNYDRIHEMNQDELEELIHNKDTKMSVKHFVEDFVTNNQKITPIVFTKNGRVINMEFFVPSKKCIWSIDYTNIKGDEIIIHSTGVEAYFKMIEDLIKKVFTDFEGEKTKLNDKIFSLKRGFPFFVKSNIVLAIIMLAIYINRNSWVYDGRDFYELFGFFSEVLILFITLIACFRPKSVKWQTTKQNQQNKGNVEITKT
jgi:hypothetical protein